MRLRLEKIHPCKYKADNLAEGLEALLLAKYLEDKRSEWIPRLPEV
jgi:hypothetical protein